MRDDYVEARTFLEMARSDLAATELCFATLDLLGDTYYYRGEFNLAIMFANERVTKSQSRKFDLGPACAYAYNDLGKAYLHLGIDSQVAGRPDADEFFSRAKKYLQTCQANLRVDYGPACWRLCLVELYDGTHDAACEYFNFSFEIDPNLMLLHREFRAFHGVELKFRQFLVDDVSRGCLNPEAASALREVLDHGTEVPRSLTPAPDLLFENPVVSLANRIEDGHEIDPNRVTVRWYRLWTSDVGFWLHGRRKIFLAEYAKCGRPVRPCIVEVVQDSDISREDVVKEVHAICESRAGVCQSILKCYGWYHDPEKHYYGILKQLCRCSVGDLLNRCYREKSPIDLNIRLRWCLDIVQAVMYTVRIPSCIDSRLQHNSGVVLLNLSLWNVMVSLSGDWVIGSPLSLKERVPANLHLRHLVLCGFGRAKNLRDFADIDPRVGTEGFRAPELSSLDVGSCSRDAFKLLDIYSLGILIWCLLVDIEFLMNSSGKPFIPDPDERERSLRCSLHLEHDTPRDHIGWGLLDLVKRCTASAGQRYTSARCVFKELRPYVAPADVFVPNAADDDPSTALNVSLSASVLTSKVDDDDRVRKFFAIPSGNPCQRTLKKLRGLLCRQFKKWDVEISRRSIRVEDRRWLSFPVRPSVFFEDLRPHQSRHGVDLDGILVTLEPSPPILYLDPKCVVMDPSVEGRVLGRGRSGLVVRGFLRKPQPFGRRGMPVAVKKMFINQEDAQDLFDFESEVKVMTEVMSHENVVECFGCFQDADIFHVVLELCDGGTLLEWLVRRKQSGVLLESDKISCMKQIANGMKHLHSQKVIHRDLKPENVLLTTDGVVKICDFGFSRHAGSVSSTIRGTSGYLPNPRHAVSTSQAWTIDVYAFGIIIWEIWTVSKAYRQERLQYGNVFLLSEIHRRQLRPDLGECVGMPSVLRDLCKSCWADLPSDRPTFSRIVAELDEIS